MSDVEKVYEDSAPTVVGVVYTGAREPGEVSASSWDGQDEGMDMDREEPSQRHDQNQDVPQPRQGEGQSFVTIADCILEEVEDDSDASIEGEDEKEDYRFIRVDKRTLRDYPALLETRMLKRELDQTVEIGNSTLEIQEERLANLESFVGDYAASFEIGLAHEKEWRVGKCHEFKGVLGKLTEKITQLENATGSNAAEVESLKEQLEMARQEKMKNDKVVVDMFSEHQKLLDQLLERDVIPVQGDQNGTVTTPNPQQIILALGPPAPPGSVDDQNKEMENDNQMEEVDQEADSSGHEGNVNVDEQEQAGESDAETQVKNVEAVSEIMETENDEDGGDPPPTGAILDNPPTPTLVLPESGPTDSKSSCRDGRPVVEEFILGAPQSNAKDEGVSTSATGTASFRRMTCSLSLGRIAPGTIKDEKVGSAVSNTSLKRPRQSIGDTVKTRARASKSQASGPSSSKISSLPKRRSVKHNVLPREKRLGKGRSSRFSQQSNMNGSVQPSTNQCPHCSANLSTKGNLKTHLLTHSGAKPFPCNHCQLSFRQKIHLHRHIRNVHFVEPPKKAEMPKYQRRGRRLKEEQGEEVGRDSKEPAINESAGSTGQPQPPSNDGGTGNESQIGAGGGKRETVELQEARLNYLNFSLADNYNFEF